MLPSEADHERLLQRVRGGDCEAFIVLVEPQLPALLAYARAICGDASSAEDVVQESLLIAMAKLDRLFPETDFSCWLKAIVRRQALSSRRGRMRFRDSPGLLDGLEAAFAIEDDALDDERAALRRCLDELPGHLTEVVDAFYRAGRSIVEIAAAQAGKEATVRTRLHRARLALRDCVERRLRREVADG